MRGERPLLWPWGVYILGPCVACLVSAVVAATFRSRLLVVGCAAGGRGCEPMMAAFVANAVLASYSVPWSLYGFHLARHSAVHFRRFHCWLAFHVLYAAALFAGLVFQLSILPSPFGPCNEGQNLAALRKWFKADPPSRDIYYRQDFCDSYGKMWKTMLALLVFTIALIIWATLSFGRQFYYVHIYRSGVSTPPPDVDILAGRSALLVRLYRPFFVWSQFMTRVVLRFKFIRLPLTIFLLSPLFIILTPLIVFLYLRAGYRKIRLLRRTKAAAAAKTTTTTAATTAIRSMEKAAEQKTEKTTAKNVKAEPKSEAVQMRVTVRPRTPFETFLGIDDIFFELVKGLHGSDIRNLGRVSRATRAAVTKHVQRSFPTLRRYVCNGVGAPCLCCRQALICKQCAATTYNSYIYQAGSMLHFQRMHLQALCSGCVFSALWGAWPIPGLPFVPSRGTADPTDRTGILGRCICDSTQTTPCLSRASEGRSGVCADCNAAFRTSDAVFSAHVRAVSAEKGTSQPAHDLTRCGLCGAEGLGRWLKGCLPLRWWRCGRCGNEYRNHIKIAKSRYW